MEIQTHNHDIQCFYFCNSRDHVASQCPKKRKKMIQMSGKMETNGKSRDEKMSPLKEASYED